MNVKMSWFVLVLPYVLFLRVWADYDCLCNYNEELKVYSAATETSSVIGSLYEFDCKPTLDATQEHAFKGLQYEQQVGYVKLNSDTQVQICAGQPSPADKVTTVATTVASRPASSWATTTRAMPSSTRNMSALSTSTATSNQPLKSTTTTHTTPTSTTPTTTHKIITSTTRFISTITTSNSAGSINTTPRIPEGHLEVCPSHLKFDISQKGGFLGQYGVFCYQYVDWNRTFDGAEAHCESLTGTLVSIKNQQEQNFFVRFLASHHFTKTAWIGLSDRQQEGKLAWVSDEPVSFTNFQSQFNHHTTDTHDINDCFAIQPNGEWVDFPCGISLAIFNFGEQHPFICQYNISAKAHTLFEALPGLIAVG